MLARHFGSGPTAAVTYRLRPDNKLDDCAAIARVSPEARAMLIERLADEDDKLLKLAQEVEAAWRERWPPVDGADDNNAR
ncbi:MAG: hypothetical protein ACREEL_01105 [Stellaceae bacterium]